MRAGARSHTTPSPPARQRSCAGAYRSISAVTMAESTSARPSVRVSTFSTRRRTSAFWAGAASSQAARCENSAPRSTPVTAPSGAAVTAEKKSLPP